MISTVPAIAEDNAQRLVDTHEVGNALQRIARQLHVFRQLFVFVEGRVSHLAQQCALLLDAAAPERHEVEEKLQRDSTRVRGVQLLLCVERDGGSRHGFGLLCRGVVLKG
ncbi:hypothetical protein D3C78_1444260 [compost metagenome]